MNNPELKKIDEYALFDWLRFILASAVVLSHEGILTWEASGNLAVQVFFSLSGWLIGGILFRTSAREMPRFYFNRATRIWVPYFFTVGSLYLVSLFRDPVNARWFEFLLYDVTFTHHWFSLRPDATTALAQMPLQGAGNHFWSIAVEEQFYLVAPFLIVFFGVGRRLAVWIALSILLLLLDTNFASIAVGVACACSRVHFGEWHLRAAPVLIGVAAASGIAMTFSEFYCIAAPSFAASIVLLAARPVSRGRIGRLLGGISFPLYLNAWMGVFAVNFFLKRWLSWVPATEAKGLLFLGSLLAGTTTYLLIDRNVMANRDNFYSRKLGLALGFIAYALVLSGLCFGFARWR